ncbi:MAG: TetR/AcrR family transcriptional regulator [Thaumarchaeota archaeon]|nr:TetR/AcrR family transcriptional regulator [Nitrososphaerota archaeon]
MQKSKPGSAVILEAAARLFSEKGYANVSIRDVCREANTTPPMIYYYFKDKKRLFEAAVSQKVTMQEFIARLRSQAALEDAARSTHAFIEVYLSSFPTEAFEPGLYMMETAKLDRASASRISEQHDEVHDVAESIVRRGVTEGAFAKTDPRSAADCLMGMLNHVIFQQFHFSKSRDVNKSKRFITEFFLRAMGSRES